MNSQVRILRKRIEHIFYFFIAVKKLDLLVVLIINLFGRRRYFAVNGNPELKAFIISSSGKANYQDQISNR